MDHYDRDLEQHLRLALKQLPLYPIQIWQRNEEGTPHAYAWSITRLDDTIWGQPHGTAATFVEALTDAIFSLETILCGQSGDRQPGDRLEQQTKHTPIPTQGTDQSSSTLTTDPWKRAYLLADMHGDLADMNAVVRHTPGKDAAWRIAHLQDNLLLAACQAFDDYNLPRLEQFVPVLAQENKQFGFANIFHNLLFLFAQLNWSFPDHWLHVSSPCSVRFASANHTRLVVNQVKWRKSA